MSALNRQNVKSDEAADAHERGKNFLNQGEVDQLLEAAKRGRHGIRDHLLVLMMYRHGLRVSEATSLRQDSITIETSRLWVSVVCAQEDCACGGLARTVTTTDPPNSSPASHMSYPPSRSLK
jgi:site-specific recombinase XerC